MNTRPKPRQFTTFEAFEAACMDFAARALPQVTPYDDYALAVAKRRDIARAQDDARAAAWEDWDWYVESRTEMYERGVGPAWA